MHTDLTTLSRPPVACICETCTTTFYTYPSRIKAGKGRFCSKACYDYGQSSRVIVQCKGCAATFEATRPSQAPRYCSKDCLARYRITRVSERFINMLDTSSPDGCWEWQGSLNIQSGYGQININRRPHLTHRLAWTLATGEMIPRGAEVCHTCDNRRCARNDSIGVYTVDGVDYPRRGHLFLATRRVNMRDMILKGRMPNRRMPHKRNRL